MTRSVSTFGDVIETMTAPSRYRATKWRATVTLSANTSPQNALSPDANQEVNSDEDKNVNAAPSHSKVSQAKKARDHLHDVKVGLSPSNRVDEESKEAAKALDEEAAQSPEIVYGKKLGWIWLRIITLEQLAGNRTRLARH
ncbi:hypothetical protein FRC05_002613 [Tulasnella sp. 425]|nr:hypothetical protein FRC05_002613 [Tulasnella sp. 425]